MCVCPSRSKNSEAIFQRTKHAVSFQFKHIIQKIYSNLLGPKILRVVLTVYNIRPLVGKLKRRNKDGRGLYLSGAKDGSGLINGTDMYASSNSKRGAELGQGALLNLKYRITTDCEFSQDRLTLSACRKMGLQTVVYKLFRLARRLLR